MLGFCAISGLRAGLCVLLNACDRFRSERQTTKTKKNGCRMFVHINGANSNFVWFFDFCQSKYFCIAESDFVLCVFCENVRQSISKHITENKNKGENYYYFQ